MSGTGGSGIAGIVVCDASGRRSANACSTVNRVQGIGLLNSAKQLSTVGLLGMVAAICRRTIHTVPRAIPISQTVVK